MLEKQEAKKEGKQSATNVFIWWLWWNEHDPELENDWCEDDLPEWCDGEPEVPAPDEPPAETVGDCPATVVDEAAFADVTGVEVGSADMDDLDSELLDAAAEFGEGTEAFETSEVADVDAGGFDAGGMDAGGADADGADAGGADAGGGDF